VRHSLIYYARAALDEALERAQLAVGRALIYSYVPIANVRLGRGLRIHGLPVIRSPRGRVVLGPNVQLISSGWRASASGIAHRVRLRTFFSTAVIEFREGSGMSGGSVTARSGKVVIGRETMIGPDCLITDSDFHRVWPPDQRLTFIGRETDADVTLGDRVWLGARCIVLKGTVIGDNSVIAAGSVVRGTIPKNTLAAGNPAVVKKVFAEGDLTTLREAAAAPENI